MDMHFQWMAKGHALLVLLLMSCGRTNTHPPVDSQGAAGADAMETDEEELAPYLSCSGAYESLPPRTPTRALPTVLEAELCNARDSRTWSIEVAANRAVSLSLENPLSIDTFRLDVYRSDVDGYEHLPVIAGETSIKLGRLAERSFWFTPARAGKVSLLAALGTSRGEATRLRIEQ